MAYKLLILAPSAGGKSTLMRYLREHTNLDIAETDELVMEANDGIWPDNDLKNKVLVPQTTLEVISRPSVVYFASYVPDDLIVKAKSCGFKVLVLSLTVEELTRRNKQRMETEGYQDAEPWFEMQLSTYERLKDEGLVDEVIDARQEVELLAKQLISYTN